MAKNYIIDFVDPSKSTITVPPNTVNGPSANAKSTDIDLIGMGSSLWGEKTLENLLHMLENFSCEEDMFDATSDDSASLDAAGDVRKSFNEITTFIGIDSVSTVTYTLDPANPPIYVSGTDTTTIAYLAGQPDQSLPIRFGTPGRPNQNYKFSPTSPVQGQVWYNQTAGQINVWDGSWKRVGGITVSSTEPTSPADGDFWWNGNFTERQLHIYISGVWERIVDDYLLRDGTKAMTGELNMASNKIINITDATAATDALNRQTADGRYINSAGDVMNGILDLNGFRIINLVTTDLEDDAMSVTFGDQRYARLETDNTMTQNMAFSGGSLSGVGAFSASSGSFAFGLSAASLVTTGDVHVGDHIVFGDSATSAIFIGPGQDFDTDTFMEFEKGGSARNFNFVVNGRNGGPAGFALKGNTFSGLYRVELRTDLQVFAGNDIDFGTNRVRNVADPQFDLDATNKQYVDAVVGGVGQVVAPTYQHENVFSNSFGGGVFLIAGKRYLIMGHGITNNRGNGTAALYNPRLYNPSGVLVATSGPNSRSINWPDGNAPQSGVFLYTASTSGFHTVRFDVNVSSHSVVAVKLTHD